VERLVLTRYNSSSLTRRTRLSRIITQILTVRYSRRCKPSSRQSRIRRTKKTLTTLWLAMVLMVVAKVIWLSSMRVEMTAIIQRLIRITLCRITSLSRFRVDRVVIRLIA